MNKKLLPVALVSLLMFGFQCRPAPSANPPVNTTSQPVAYKFEDFPAERTLNGKPSNVNFNSDPAAQQFMTAIKKGASMGPNFAGKYTIIDWGCGTECQSHAIVDGETGEIIKFGLNSRFGIDFRLDSRLLVINPMSNWPPTSPEGLKVEYYEMKDAKLIKLN